MGIPASSQVLFRPSDLEDHTDPAHLPSFPKHGLATTHSHAKEREVANPYVRNNNVSYAVTTSIRMNFTLFRGQAALP
ncbi:hypothetical protein EJB05_49537, partial [Eragrostis curvula]